MSMPFYPLINLCKPLNNSSRYVSILQRTTEKKLLKNKFLFFSLSLSVTSISNRNSYVKRLEAGYENSFDV